MNLPSNPVTWLKIAGTLSTAIGSILLAFRVKMILKWIVYCLVAHEQSITQLGNLLSNQEQTEQMVEGVTKHLLDVESKLGVILLILGFLLLGIGMLCNVVMYLFWSS